MIQPIKDIFTNWRNPQHRQVLDITYDIGVSGVQEISVLSDSEVSVVYRTPPPSHIVTATMGGIAPDIDKYYPSPSLTILRIVVPAESGATYIAWKDAGGELHVLRDER